MIVPFTLFKDWMEWSKNQIFVFNTCSWHVYFNLSSFMCIHAQSYTSNDKEKSTAFFKFHTSCHESLTYLQEW